MIKISNSINCYLKRVSGWCEDINNQLSEAT